MSGFVRRPRGVRPLTEPLENRVLLCSLQLDEHGLKALGLPISADDPLPQYVDRDPTRIDTLGIRWANRGSAANDSDGFNGIFGANAAAARNVVQRAVDDWRRVFPNLNQDGGNNQLDVTITMGARGSGLGGTGGSSTLLGSKPRTGAITIGGGADINNNSNVEDGEGWYIDPTPGEMSEFAGTPVHAYLAVAQAGSAAAGLADLYSLVTIEMQHVLGMDDASGTAWRNNVGNYLSNTGQADNTDTPGTLYTFTSNNVTGLLTSNNGGAGGQNRVWAIHTADPNNSITVNSVAYRGFDDTGTAVYAPGSRYLPSGTSARMLQNVYAYGFVPPEQFGTAYAHLNADGSLRIVGGPQDNLGAASNDFVSVFQFGTQIGVRYNLSNQASGEFPRGDQTAYFDAAAISRITVDTGGGNDTVEINRFVDYPNLPITVTGGGGTDTLRVIGVSGNPSQAAIVTATSVTGGYTNVASYQGFESVNVQGTTGDDVIRVHGSNSLAPLTVTTFGGNDQLRIDPPTGGLVTFGSAVTWDSGGGVDSLQVNLGPSNFRLRIEARSTAVTADEIDGFGDLTVNLVAFGAPLDTLNITGGANSDQFLLPDNTVSGSFSGFDGDDRMTIGGGNLGLYTASFNTFGGSGSDTLELDDSQYSGAVDWYIDQTGVYRGTISTQQFLYGGFENASVLTGAGGTRGDYIDVVNNLTVGLNVSGGPGGDILRLTELINTYSNGITTTVYPVHFDLGTGPNSLTVIETDPGLTNFELWPDRLKYKDFGISTGTDFTFASVTNGVTVNANNDGNTFRVYGAPGGIVGGFQSAVVGNGGDDTFIVYPHDAAGNLTVNFALGILGGTGSDTLTIDDSASLLPISYGFINPFGATVQNISGLGTNLIGANNDVERIVVSAGGGSDTFTVSTFQTGQRLELNGGGGDDACTIGNGDLSASLTNASFFGFDGQGGADRFNISNSGTDVPWTYDIFAGLLIAHRSGYSWSSSVSNIESQYLLAGSSDDTFKLEGVPSGVYTECNGAAGIEVMYLGLAGGSVEAIRGPVRFNPGAEITAIWLSDANDATGDVFHLDQSSLGAYPGDNLFGGGGSLTFGQIVNVPNSTGITIFAPVNSTVYAQPFQSVRTEIFSGGNFSPPSGQLNLALAGVAAPVVSGTPASGSLTSGNRWPILWQRFAGTIQADAIAPVSVASGFSFNTPIQAVTFQFGENVGATLTAGALVLQNLSTGQIVPPSAIALGYHAGTNTATFTFPGLPGSILPDGDYLATLPAGSVRDSFGNPSASDATLSFFVLAGDADRDRSVGIGDFSILASRFNQPGTFSQGDFNYNGSTEIGDFAILASKFNTSLPAPGGSPALHRAGSPAKPSAWRVPVASEPDDLNELRDLIDGV